MKPKPTLRLSEYADRQSELPTNFQGDGVAVGYNMAFGRLLRRHFIRYLLAINTVCFGATNYF